MHIHRHTATHGSAFSNKSDNILHKIQLFAWELARYIQFTRDIILIKSDFVGDTAMITPPGMPQFKIVALIWLPIRCTKLMRWEILQ